MPASLLHFTFVKENMLKNKYGKLMPLGGQGPDVFFFYGYSLHKREYVKEIQNFGVYLHHIDISEAYSFLMEYAYKNDKSEMLFTFIRGLFMHYILDRNVHPYVFYRTGFSLNNDEKEAKLYFYYHASYEGYMDLFYGKEHKTYRNPRLAINARKKDVKVVSKMFAALAEYLHYDHIDKNSYLQAWEDMKVAEEVLFSPLGFKKFIIHKKMPQSVPDAMCMPHKRKPLEQYDVLNINKKPWADCLTNKERNESVSELVLKAKEELPYLDEILNLAKNGGDIKDKVVKFVHKIDHDGFLVGHDKKYFKLYKED